MSTITPSLFGVALAATPPSVALRSLMVEAHEYGVATVPCSRPVKSVDDANRLAPRQLSNLSREDLRDLECAAAHIEGRPGRR